MKSGQSDLKRKDLYFRFKNEELHSICNIASTKSAAKKSYRPTSESKEKLDTEI